MSTRIQVRRDTSANWATADPVLAEGEFGLDVTTATLKVGDGVTAWSSLSALGGGGGGATTLDGLTDVSTAGQSSGKGLVYNGSLWVPSSAAVILEGDARLTETLPASIVDAKGDLIVATAADTVARLPVGATTGHVLTVDPAEATGLKWAAGGGVAGQGKTIIFAASDSHAEAKAMADVVCSGTADQTAINAALDAAGQFTRAIFKVGIYSLTGPVTINYDLVTLEGEIHPFWKSYATGGPAGAQSSLSDGCSQFRVVSSGVNGISITNANLVESRRRGICIRDMYLSSNYRNGTGIISGAGDMDWCRFENNTIHNFGVGISVALDASLIINNTIQDIASDAIVVTSGTYAQIRGNLIYDLIGRGIVCANSAATIMGNQIGRTSTGIDVSVGRCQIVGNHIQDCRAGSDAAIKVNGTRNAVSGNTIDDTNGIPGIVAPSTLCAITGNTVCHTGTASSIGINLTSGENNGVVGNTVSGWTTNIQPSALANKIRDNVGYTDAVTAVAATVADGGTVTHGLPAIPHVTATATVAGEFASVTAVSATTFTVALKKHDGTAGTTQSVNWYGCTPDLPITVGGSSGDLPAVTTGTLIGFWDASTLTGANGSAVTSVPDPMGNYALAGTNATLATAAQNSLNAVTLNGTSAYLRNATMAAQSQPFTAFVACKSTSSAGDQCVFGGASKDPHVSAFINSATLKLWNGATVAAGPAASTSAAHVLEIQFNGAATLLGVDGTMSGSLTGGTTQKSAGYLFGVNPYNSTPVDGWFAGQFYEAVFYSGALNSTDRATVRAHLGTKWGITVS